MQFIFRYLPERLSLSHFDRRRTFVDTPFKWVRDRGLDHAVEREKHLRPLLNLKNFINSEPSKSVPVTIITQKRDSLQIPVRSIEFIRKYPSVFEEFLPGGIGIHPHIRLTPEVLNLDAEEQLVYQSETYKKQAADRVLKLLMISRANKIPLSIIERLKWDLGLPRDYEKTIVPEFPDYFQIVGDSDSSKGSEDRRVLELVCWSNELATSVMEKMAMNGKSGFQKGMAIAFPLKFSRGFEMDKNLKKWEDEWQKLSYISPYENASHLLPKSDESDKWAVAVLHELLHILVSKKTERDNILHLGECLGLRSRFKRALLHHPGIFYLSSKIGSFTVVLKEGYKRGLLVENHPLMIMRNRYIHLMNTVKEDSKQISMPAGNSQKKKQTGHDEKGKENEEENDGESGEEDDRELDDSSDAEVEDAGEHEYDNNDRDEEDGNESRRAFQKHVVDKRGKKGRKTMVGEKGQWRKFENKRAVGRQTGKTWEKAPSKVHRREKMHGGNNVRGSSRERSNIPKSRERSSPDKRTFTQ